MMEYLDEAERQFKGRMFSSEQGWALGFAKWTNWNAG